MNYGFTHRQSLYATHRFSSLLLSIVYKLKGAQKLEELFQWEVYAQLMVQFRGPGEIEVRFVILPELHEVG